MVGAGDLKGIFQPKELYDSMIIVQFVNTDPVLMESNAIFHANSDLEEERHARLQRAELLQKNTGNIQYKEAEGVQYIWPGGNLFSAFLHFHLASSPVPTQLPTLSLNIWFPSW